jgi:hypothetical protein
LYKGVIEIKYYRNPAIHALLSEPNRRFSFLCCTALTDDRDHCQKTKIVRGFEPSKAAHDGRLVAALEQLDMTTRNPVSDAAQRI